MSKNLVVVALLVLVGTLFVVLSNDTEASAEMLPEVITVRNQEFVYYKGALAPIGCQPVCEVPCADREVVTETVVVTRVVTVEVPGAVVIDMPDIDITLPVTGSIPAPEATPLLPVIEEDIVISIDPEPTPSPSPSPSPTPTPTPNDDDEEEESTPDEKPHCNQGVGNGSEGCSPGRSDDTVNPDHPHGPNDEDPSTGPGSPGRRGGNPEKPPKKSKDK